MDTPKLYDPPLHVFTLWFIFIYILGYFIIFKSWNKNYRSEASSCLMSLAHGTPALGLSIFSILQSQNNTSQLDFTSPNTPFQNLVLEYSIAYFLMDLLHYMVCVPSEVLFIAHHIATLYVLMTCRYVFGHGAGAVLGILVLAEAESAKAAIVFEFLSPYFYAYYTVVRGILGPAFVYKMGLVFASRVDSGMIPRWAWVSWIVVIVAGIGVSILWVVHLWIDLYRLRSKEVKKLS
ncbi:hypothetical protein PHJA_002886000 [Phtheirospermum japonicum]|uniref:TLC domain-containing protein n=1 Tax=Phtheirospermum japonicum TaxID=374723 RepID=A0A830DCI4_9LAMI|nr:hypothetical protein PHJA_002886000 [Phtheirospermum japonicum]